MELRWKLILFYPHYFKVSIAAVKHHGPNFYITIHHQKKFGQELKHGRNLEAGANAETTDALLFLTCSACFLMERRATSPRMTPAIIHCSLQHQSLAKTMSYMLAYSLLL